MLVDAAAQQDGRVDYVASQSVAGTIRVAGSPQMGELLRLYEQGFAAVQPKVRFEQELNSTVTAVDAVSARRADVALLGREIWPTELQAFESARGHVPTVIDIATGSYDVHKATFALMIFVPKVNPLRSLTLGQLERVFGAGQGDVTTWGELGLRGVWANRAIHLYGFSVNNDKSQIFSQLVFEHGERWNLVMKGFSNGAGPDGEDAGERIVRAVAEDQDAIGISNVHYAVPGVKALSLSAGAGAQPVAATRTSVADRSYPLTRAVYLVVDEDAAQPETQAVREFVRYVLSRQGAMAVQQEGNYLPLPAAVARRQLERMDAWPR